MLQMALPPKKLLHFLLNNVILTKKMLEAIPLAMSLAILPRPDDSGHYADLTIKQISILHLEILQDFFKFGARDQMRTQKFFETKLGNGQVLHNDVSAIFFCIRI